jgi:two-component system sensor histidine kinase AtoS
MKKKIIISLSIFSLVFFLGGIYIMVTIQKSTSTLNDLIRQHQVEILREHLLLQIKRVQTDLSLHNTRYAQGVDTIIIHVRNLDQIVNTCFDCHHSGQIFAFLRQLRNETNDYQGALSKVLTIRANPARSKAAEDHAFRLGEDLVTKVNRAISFAKMRLDRRTKTALLQIEKTKILLFVLLAIGPFMTLGLTVLLVRWFMKPVNVLLEATRFLKAGDLDHKIVGLEHEFGEVASSFNDMASSLKEQMRKKLESQKRYSTLFECAGDAIFIIDAQGENAGQIVSANRAAAEMHGYEPDELLKMSILDLDAPNVAKEVSEKINKMLSGDVMKLEMAHRRKDGTVFPVEVSTGVFEFEGHKYIFAFDRDITERKEAELRLQRTEQMVACGELSTRLAHEIKNPLAGIKLSMEVLSDEPTLAPEDKEVLGKVVDEVQRIESLLKNLLNFARPSKPQLFHIDMRDVLEKTLSFLQKYSTPSSKKPETLKIVREFEEGLPQMMADPMQLQQIFLNLFLNAIDAMRGNGTLLVRTFHDVPAEGIRVEISDTGKGIEEEMREKLFQPFYTTKSKGTGLGLTITKQLVEQHNGTISVSRNPEGEGTTFTLFFPLNTNLEEVQRG